MSNTTINTLNQIIDNITFYVLYFTIIAGTLGSLFNLLTFTSKQLRNNPCGLYFLFSSIFDLIYLMFSALTRLLNDHYPYVLPRRSTIFCKIRIYLSTVVPALATFFIALASVDRCFLTSNSKKWRNLSHIKIARWISIFSISFWALIFSHILVYFELRLPNVHSDISLCVPKAGIYTTFVSIFFLVCNAIIMYTVMFVASVTTLIHIRTIRNRNRMRRSQIQRRRFQKLDRHLITIMFFQVGIGMLLTVFRCTFLMYSLLTNNRPKSLYRTTIESFFDRLSINIYYLSFVKSFAVNTMSSPLFRDIFCQRIMKIWHTLISLSNRRNESVFL